MMQSLVVSVPLKKSLKARSNCELTFWQQPEKQPDGSNDHVSADDAAVKRISVTASAGRCSHAEKGLDYASDDTDDEMNVRASERSC